VTTSRVGYAGHARPDVLAPFGVRWVLRGYQAGMFTSLLRAQALRRAARFLPGGWVTLVVLHPVSRQIGAAAARRGWREVQKRRGR
jgi:hypothetical protein